MKRKDQKVIHRVGDPDPLHPGKKLLTRRDFLSSGLLGFSGTVLMPTVADLLLMERARAEGINCPAGGAAPGIMPFLVFDCAGGAALPGNWVVGKAETRPAGGANSSFSVDAAAVTNLAGSTDATNVRDRTVWNTGATPGQLEASAAFRNAFQPLAAYDALGLVSNPVDTLGLNGEFELDTRYGAPMARTAKSQNSTTARFISVNTAVTTNSTNNANGSQNVTNANNIQSQVLVALNNEIPDGTDKTWTFDTTKDPAASATNLNVPPKALTLATAASVGTPSNPISPTNPLPGTPAAGTAYNFQQYLRMGTICHTSLSDSNTNMLNAVTMVASAGSVGNRIRVGLGTNSSNSGGNSDAANFNGQFKPMSVRDVAGLNTALGYGPAFKNLSQGVKDAIARALVNLTGTQAANFTSMNLGDQLSTLAKCGYIKNKDYTGSGADLNVLTDTTLTAKGVTTAVFGNLQAGSRDHTIATMMYAALSGASGPAVITIGGCDYHTNNRTVGDGRDAELGVRIGQAVHLAGLLNVPFAFQVITDGGISSAGGSRNWAGDDNDHGLTVFGVFDPSGPKDMVSTQISTYNGAQGADRTHFLGTDPALVASTVFLNYLSATGLGVYQSSNDDVFTKKISTTTSFPDQLRKKLLLFKPTAA